METIYITGHKVPDLDSVAAAVSYAHLKQQTDPGREYIPVAAGEFNAETSYVFDKFGVKKPDVLTSLSGKLVILVDHNEKGQATDDLEGASILEIIDHHKMDFSYGDPIRVIIEPIGSTCSVIAKMYKADGIDIPQDLAGIMLGAVLTDTVITKSPTTTEDDLNVIEELARTAEIDDWRKFGMEIFKVRSSVSSLSDKDIVTADYKDFDINGRKFGIGQVETVDISQFDDRLSGLIKALEEKRAEGDYHSVLLFISDIIKEESLFLVSSEEPDKVAIAFGKEIKDGIFTAKVLSRKKEVVPSLLKTFS